MFLGRGPNKIQNPITLVDAYKDYIKLFEENNPYYVSCKEYRKICELYYKKIMDKLIDDGTSFKLPYRLGTIYIRRKKTNRKHNLFRLKVDFKKTNELGKTIYHLNEHSNGYQYSFKWSKQSALFKNKGKYRFVPSRANKRRLAAKIKDGYINYIEEKR